MQSNFYIKYKGKDEVDDSIVELSALGESILGFDCLIKELIKIAGINGEVNVEASRVREGSLIIDLVIKIVSNSPFYNLRDYYEFLKFAGAELPKINLGVDQLKRIHGSLNDFAGKSPFDFNLIMSCLPFALKEMFVWLGKQKNKVVVESGTKRIPAAYAVKMHRLIGRRNKNCKKAVTPFVDDKIKEIQLSDKGKFIEPVVIDSKNFSDYLNKDAEILPELETNKKYKFYGKVVGLLSDRGDYMKIKIEALDKRHNVLIAFPGEGSTTKEFRKYYNEHVQVAAHVLRQTPYQKPRLVIESIKLLQEKMV
jgi:hypothetical protein